MTQSTSIPSTTSDVFEEVDLRTSVAGSAFVPTAALLVMLLAAQQYSVHVASHVELSESTKLLFSTPSPTNLLDELLAFHNELARSQTDLPEDAARLLRENLWSLYE